MTNNTFENLKLNTNLLKGVYAYGFKEPSTIQLNGIKIVSSPKDCIIQSNSGTGKTATYLLGVLNKLCKNNLCQGIIITPTRELALQVYTVASELSKYSENKIIKCIGGTNVKENIDDSNGCNLVIGTLGRVYHLISKNHIKINNVKFIILDEVDELLSNNINNEIIYILNNISKDSQKILISATMTINVFNLGKQFLKEPDKILLNNNEMVVNLISQFYIEAENEDQQYETLLDLYNLVSTTQAIIFCNTIESVLLLEKKLTDDNFSITTIHSNISSENRNSVMENFRKGLTRILLTSDLLSRGIDISAVNMVINYELPYKTETYIHRIGRCGRFNKKGIAINIIQQNNQNDKNFFTKLNKEYGIVIKEMPDNLDDYL